MRVTVGWASEYARDKFTVEMTEQDDLPGLIAEAGLDQAAVLGPDVQVPLSNLGKFLLLRTEAEIFSLQTAMDKKVVPAAEGSVQMDALLSKKTQLLGFLKGQYAPPPARQPAVLEGA